MGVKTGFLDVDDSRIYYEDAGTGECLILIHGFACDTRVWDDQFEPLATRYRVVRYDLRGFGKSDPPRECYSTLDDLEALMNALAIDRAWVAGLSLGGALAVEFALQCPDRVVGLVLVSSTLRRFPYSDSYVQRFLDYRRIARRKGLPAARHDLLSSPLLERLSDDPALVERAKAILEDYQGFHWLYPDPHRVFYPPAIDRLSEIDVPVQIVVGENDLADIHGVADRLATDIAHAEKVIIPDAGHMVNMEKPEEFNQVVLDFVAQGGRRQRSRATAVARHRANVPLAHGRTRRA
jgi:pimeloyl-ACP methyl ester carboxylesterase